VYKYQDHILTRIHEEPLSDPISRLYYYPDRCQLLALQGSFIRLFIVPPLLGGVHITISPISVKTLDETVNLPIIKDHRETSFSAAGCNRQCIFGVIKDNLVVS